MQGDVLQVVAITAGGLILLGYGIFVNVAPIDFGRLLGGYVVIFFVVAQISNLLAFGVRPGLGMLIGGTLIVAGGAFILSKP